MHVSTCDHTMSGMGAGGESVRHVAPWREHRAKRFIPILFLWLFLSVRPALATDIVHMEVLSAAAAFGYAAAAESRSSDEDRAFNVAVLGSEFTRHDYMGSAEDRMLIEAVERDPHAIAYVALSAYVANRSRVRAVPIVLKAGANPVMPSSANVAGGAYSSLTRAIFIYVSTDALERRGVDAFAEHLARHAARLAKGADLVPLTDSIYQAGVSRLRARRAGSIWGGGTPVGLTMQALQRKFLAM
jgi:hypothetical protein